MYPEVEKPNLPAVPPKIEEVEAWFRLMFRHMKKAIVKQVTQADYYGITIDYYCPTKNKETGFVSGEMKRLDLRAQLGRTKEIVDEETGEKRTIKYPLYVDWWDILTEIFNPIREILIERDPALKSA